MQTPIISFTPGIEDAVQLAQRQADRQGKPFGVWEHVGQYGLSSGDIPARHTFRVSALDKPDPPSDWALVATCDPATGLTLSKSRLGVEHNISPPMAAAITVPVYRNGRDTGVSVYISMSPFAATGPQAPTVHMLRQVAELLTLKEELQ